MVGKDGTLITCKVIRSKMALIIHLVHIIEKNSKNTSIYMY